MPSPRKRSVGIRPATAGDKEFILSLVPRFVAFKLPKGRRKRECIAAVRGDIERALRKRSQSERFFVSENVRSERTGFMRVQVQRDFFSGTRACHVSDLAVAEGRDGQGIGRTLLDHAQAWAKANRCKLMTLAVFPGNARARELYEHAGFDTDLLRLSKRVK